MTNENFLTSISISGFKSIRDATELKFAPLTLLAGANSSGKTSIMQPLLLLKQTLEATYDPGALLLDGENVRFTSSEQFLRKVNGVYGVFEIRLIDMGDEDENTRNSVALRFKRDEFSRRIQIVETIFSDRIHKQDLRIFPEMTLDEFQAQLSPAELTILSSDLSDPYYSEGFKVIRNRSFLDLEQFSPTRTIFVNLLQDEILSIIHVPGLRNPPERTYKIAAVGEIFPGTFEHYVASIIDEWQRTHDPRFQQVADHLLKLGLTSKIAARPLNDVQIELMVSRPQAKRTFGEMVSIADVGMGVSQVLPVIVALLVAQPGQLVYLEQPELHLHPRAQVGLASLLGEAAKRGVRVVAETHSSLLLQGIQTLIAKDELPSELVRLNWFSLNEEGCTVIDSVQPDENGAYGTWGEDLSDIQMDIQSEYIDAVVAKHSGD